MDITNQSEQLISEYKIILTDDVIKALNYPIPRSSDALDFASLLSDNEKNADKDLLTYFSKPENIEIFNQVSVENLKNSLINIVMGKKPSLGFEFLRLTGLLKNYYPWLDDCYGVEQNEYHAHDVYYHLIYSCDAAMSQLPIRLSALFHDIGKVKAKRKIQKGEDEKDVFYNHEIIGSTICYKTLIKLKFDNDIAKKVSKLVRFHMFHYTNEWSDGAIRRFLRKVGDDIRDLFHLRNADRRGNGKRISSPQKLGEFKSRIKKVIEYDSRITVKSLVVNGNDIINEFGIRPGPMVGKILNNLLELIKENEENNNKDFLLTKAKEFYALIKE